MGERPRNHEDWTTRPRPLSTGRSYINRKGEEKKDDEAHTNMGMDLALDDPTELEPWDNGLWLGDTRTSCHMTNTLEGMKNLTKIQIGIVFGNGQRLKATFVREKVGTVVQRDGKRVLILLKNVKYAPELYIPI